MEDILKKDLLLILLGLFGLAFSSPIFSATDDKPFIGVNLTKYELLLKINRAGTKPEEIILKPYGKDGYIKKSTGKHILINVEFRRLSGYNKSFNKFQRPLQPVFRANFLPLQLEFREKERTIEATATKYGKKDY